MDAVVMFILSTAVLCLIGMVAWFGKSWVERIEQSIGKLFGKIDKNAEDTRRDINGLALRFDKRLTEVEKKQIETDIRCKMRHNGYSGGGSTAPLPSARNDDGGGI